MKNLDARVQPLSPGHALLIVSEGEVMVQRPAEWLAGTVVMNAPMRVAAPAAIDVHGNAAISAMASAKYMTLHPPRAMASLVAWLRGTAATPALRTA